MKVEICADCGWTVKEIGRTSVCIRCFVRKSTAAQGIPEKVEDPVMLHDCAVLLGRR